MALGCLFARSFYIPYFSPMFVIGWFCPHPATQVHSRSQRLARHSCMRVPFGLFHGIFINKFASIKFDLCIVYVIPSPFQKKPFCILFVFLSIFTFSILCGILYFNFFIILIIFHYLKFRFFRKGAVYYNLYANYYYYYYPCRNFSPGRLSERGGRSEDVLLVKVSDNHFSTRGNQMRSTSEEMKKEFLGLSKWIVVYSF